MSTIPRLFPGKAYRTRDLRRWTSNPPRLARKLESEGKLVALARGLYAAPRKSRFGVVLPRDEELLRAFLDGSPFVFTGSEQWNSLGLGTTGVFASTLVYNTKRSGEFEFGNRRYSLRRVVFPKKPTREWFVVDLFEHASQAGTSREALARALVARVAEGAFDRQGLAEMARLYGTRATLRFVSEALRGSAA